MAFLVEKRSSGALRTRTISIPQARPLPPYLANKIRVWQAVEEGADRNGIRVELGGSGGGRDRAFYGDDEPVVLRFEVRLDIEAVAAKLVGRHP